MNVFSLLRYLLPLQNPLGFGLSDFLELGVAVLLLAGFVLRKRLSRLLQSIAARPALSMGLLFALPILLRLALLPRHPVPVPQTSDDFSFLLLADTLAHFRLANPVHPMRRFFETVFVLQEPSYSSIYPLGQGIALALGELVFREPWAGVLISIGSFCALTYWMLRAWVSPVWALVGGLLTVVQFGPLNQWTNNYWGGAMSAIAGCLVFGALPRLWRNGRSRDAALLGAGCGLQILSRPFESAMLTVCLALPVVLLLRAQRRNGGILLLALAPALLLVVLQNEAVTGSVTEMPYMASRYQYGVPAAFTFQPNPIPHKELNREQQLDYQAQIDVHGDSPETLGSFCKRLFDRVRFFRFFFLPPLFVALFFFLPSLRRRPYLWAAGSVAIFELGSNCYPYYYPHYIAAVTCLLVLFSVVGLERLSRLRIRGFEVGRDAALILASICIAHFTFWYGLHLLGNDSLFIATGPYESWDFVNFGDAEGRMAINRRLAAVPGQQLVIVKLGPAHLLREWIHNDADIDRSPVVWALDLGPEEDAKLIGYYPNRTVWTAEPDAKPPRLDPYLP